MHPVDYLFEDIYRNYWGIAPKRMKGEPIRTKPVRQSLFRRRGR